MYAIIPREELKLDFACGEKALNIPPPQFHFTGAFGGQHWNM